jgi:hypothetical protein
MGIVLKCLLMEKLLKFSYMEMTCILGITNILVHGSIRRCKLKFGLSYGIF